MNAEPLPNDRRAERDVIYALLEDPTRTLNDCPHLLPEHFYFTRYGKIWSLARMMQHGGDYIHLTTLYSAAGRDEPEVAETVTEVLQNGSGAGCSFRADVFADIVLEKYARRTVIDTLKIAGDYMLETNHTAEEVALMVQEQLRDIKSQRGGLKPAADYRVESEQRIADLIQGHTSGIQTGFRRIDRLLCGMLPQTVTVLAGRPSSGKTTFAMNVIQHALESQPDAVAVFTLEQSAPQLLCRLTAAKSRQNLRAIKDPKTVMAANDWIHSRKLWLDQRGGLKPGQMFSEVKRVNLQERVALVVIDRLELVHATERSGKLMEDTTNAMHDIKAMAKNLEMPVLLLVQLNRRSANEKRLARPEDLRQAGAIEEDATQVILLNDELEADDIPKHYDGVVPDSLLPYLTLVEVAKNQDAPTGRELLRFHREQTRFEELNADATEAG